MLKPQLRASHVGLALCLLMSTAAFSQSGPGHQQANSSAQVQDPRPIKNLMIAAQRLRDATHDLVREPATAQRNEMIKKIDRTLIEVQDAMLTLPPELMLAAANESQSQKASDDLARAADHLNTAASSLRTDATPDRQREALTEIKNALSAVQRERMNIGGSSSSSAQNTASSASSVSKPAGQEQSLPEALKQRLRSAGYSNIEIVPGSFLVSANDKDGSQVLMRISPDSMTVLTEVGSARQQNSTSGQGESGSTGSR